MCGGVPVEYHTLNDFRSQNAEALRAVLTRSVSALIAGGVVSVETVAVDGVRVRASAGAASFRSARRLRERPAVNAYVTTDTQHGFVLDAYVTANATDNAEIPRVVERLSKAYPGAPVRSVLADSGFWGEPAMAAMEGVGVTVYTPVATPRGDRKVDASTEDADSCPASGGGGRTVSGWKSCFPHRTNRTPPPTASTPTITSPKGGTGEGTPGTKTNRSSPMTSVSPAGPAVCVATPRATSTT